MNRRDGAGWSALHLACLGSFPEHESHTPIVEILLAHGAAVNVADVCGLRPIHICTDTSALRLLIEAGAEPEPLDQDGRSPLLTLSADNSVVLLQQSGVDLHRRDRYGRTALHITSDPNKVRLLVARGCDKDARDKDGKVILSDTLRDHPMCCMVCLFSDFLLFVCLASVVVDQTPLDWSLMTDRPEVSDVLRELGAHSSAELDAHAVEEARRKNIQIALIVRET